jgi:hypothetical protein
VATFTALYDACFLYPAPLRDLLLELSLTDLFRAKWSSYIHQEWIRAVLEDRPDLTAVQLHRTRDLMDLHARDCLVEDFEELIPSLTLPDTNDRHVLAAAIRGRADIIVTYNLTDFPDKELQKYGITSQHPDELQLHLFNLAPSIVCAAVRTHRARLKYPAKTTAEYFETLERQSLTQFVAALRPYAAHL